MIEHSNTAANQHNVVGLFIEDPVLRDLVEISLRLDGIPVESEIGEKGFLLLADVEGYRILLEKGWNISGNNILLLISDESDIPEKVQYLMVPKLGNEYKLDSSLLVRKVTEMITGKKPAAERNPVTGLPGAAAFEAELRERINTGERFGVIFADLNLFKNYNKAYSYARGDEMLVAIAELLENILERHSHPQNFLSHMGSDDFTIITSEKLAPVIAAEIVDKFDEVVAPFYDVADLARGSVVLTDRSGKVSYEPLVTISLAVILSSKRTVSHAAEVIDVAEELLRFLKSRDIVESCCIVDPAR